MLAKQKEFVRVVVFAVSAVFAPFVNAGTRHYSDIYSWAQGVAWVQSLPGLKYVSASIVAKSVDKNVSLDGIRFLIHKASGDVVVPINADGTFTVPITADLISDDPVVEFTSHVRLSLSVKAEAAPVDHFDYDLVQKMADEYFAVINRQNFLPDEMKYAHVKGLAIQPSEGQELRVASSCGVSTKVKDGVTMIAYDRQIPADCAITMSGTPKSMTLVFGRF